MPPRVYARTSSIQQVLRNRYPAQQMDLYDVYSSVVREEPRNARVTRPETSAGHLSDEEFEQWLLDAPCTIVNPEPLASPERPITEEAFFDTDPFSNIYVHRHLNYCKDIPHAFAFFEMLYVYRGQCSLLFADKVVSLRRGDFLIVAPETTHSVLSDDDNFIVSILARRTDFEDTFRTEQSRTNPLAHFFRRTLFDRTSRGFLLFHTGADEDLTYQLKNVAVESGVRDDYSFMLAHCWLSILLSNMVRTHSQHMEVHPPVLDDTTADILQFIQQHYQTVTLNDLCRQFSYTKPYLCTLIKRTTGQTFSQLVNARRANAAATMLSEGRYSVHEIARRVGYVNVDYFSRMFKKVYGVSPSAYRKHHST